MAYFSWPRTFDSFLIYQFFAASSLNAEQWYSILNKISWLCYVVEHVSLFTLTYVSSTENFGMFIWSVKHCILFFLFFCFFFFNSYSQARIYIFCIVFYWPYGAIYLFIQTCSPWTTGLQSKQQRTVTARLLVMHQPKDSSLKCTLDFSFLHNYTCSDPSRSFKQLRVQNKVFSLCWLHDMWPNYIIITHKIFDPFFKLHNF